MNDRLIARLWRTEVDPDRADDYERFARDESLPMFERQPGFAGVLMLRDGACCTVITFWRNAESIAALDRSASYRETVDKIRAQGFLRGEQRVEILDAHLLALPGAT